MANKYLIYIYCAILLKCILCSNQFHNIMPLENDNFGPYILEQKSFEFCRGPKSINMTEIDAKLEDVNNMTWLFLNFTFLGDVSIKEVKIMVYTLKDKEVNLVWVYNMPDPCQHFFIANVLKNHLNATTCLVKKGNYPVTQVLTGLSEQFLGPTFFYGKFLFKVRMLSKNANLACFTVMSIIKKKTQ